jgi:hypothetical protein
MSNTGPQPQPSPSFVARQLESAALKSRKASDAVALRKALVTAADALRDGKPLIIDLLVDLEAVALEPQLAAANVVHWRKRPSKGLGARAQRLLGFYSSESTLCAAVQVETGAQAVALMPEDSLWDCEFTLYPASDITVSELPDPHFDVPNFCGHVQWSIMQDSSDTWMITAVDVPTIARVCGELNGAFVAAGLACTIAEVAPFPIE